MKAQEVARIKAAEEDAKLQEEIDLKSTLGVVDGDKIESLTNRELVNLVADAVETSAEARSKQFDKLVSNKIEVLSNQIMQTQKAVMSVATSIDVKDVRSQHKDFDEYQKDAAIIMQDTPGISVQDAYLLAKAKKAESLPNKENLERERPDTSVSRSHSNRAEEIVERRERQQESASRGKGRSTGISAFREMIDSGIDRALANRG
jgi:G3E family GTPase